MTGAGLFRFVALLVVLAITVPQRGRYMATVYGSRTDGSPPVERLFAPIDRHVYRAVAVDDQRERRWKLSAVAPLASSMVSFLVYAVRRFQAGMGYRFLSRRDDDAAVNRGEGRTS